MESISLGKPIGILVVVGAVDDEDNVKYVIASIKAGIQEWARKLEISATVDDALVKFDAQSNVNTDYAGLAPSSKFTYDGDEAEIRVLISPSCFDVNQEIARLILRSSSHRLVVYGGHSIDSRPNWCFQDGVFETNDLEYVLNDSKVTANLQSTNSVASLTLSCLHADQWTLNQANPLINIVFLDPFKAVDGRKEERSTCGKGMSQFVVKLEDVITEQVQGIFSQLDPPPHDGFLKIRNPCLYVFPSGNGDSAFFTVNGFNILINGGALTRPWFWRLLRHQDRVDCILSTHLGSDSLTGINSFFLRKVQERQLVLPMDNTTEEYKQIARCLISPDLGVFFMNSPTKFAEFAHRKGNDSIHEENETGDINGMTQQLNFKTTDLVRDTLRLAKALDIEVNSLTRKQDPVPFTLFSKFGIGKLDMYVISPEESSKELQYIREKWGCDKKSVYHMSKTGVKLPSGEEGESLASDLASICCLLVWYPASPSSKIIRVLFPGNTSQEKIFEGLEKMKHMDFLSMPCPTGSILQEKKVTTTKSSRSATSKNGVNTGLKGASTSSSLKSAQAVSTKSNRSAANKFTKSSAITKKPTTTKKQLIKVEPTRKAEKALKKDETIRSKREPQEIAKNLRPADTRPKVDKPQRALGSATNASSNSKVKSFGKAKTTVAAVQAKTETRVMAKQATSKSTAKTGGSARGDAPIKSAKLATSKSLQNSSSQRKKTVVPSHSNISTKSKTSKEKKSSTLKSNPKTLEKTPPAALEDLTKAFTKLSNEKESSTDQTTTTIGLTKRPSPEGQSVAQFAESNIDMIEDTNEFMKEHSTEPSHSEGENVPSKIKNIILKDTDTINQLNSEEKKLEEATSDYLCVSTLESQQKVDDVQENYEVSSQLLHCDATDQTKDQVMKDSDISAKDNIIGSMDGGIVGQKQLEIDTLHSDISSAYTFEKDNNISDPEPVLKELGTCNSTSHLKGENCMLTSEREEKDVEELLEEPKDEELDFQNGNTPYYPEETHDYEQKYEIKSGSDNEGCQTSDRHFEQDLDPEDFQNGDTPFYPEGQYDYGVKCEIFTGEEEQQTENATECEEQDGRIGQEEDLDEAVDFSLKLEDEQQTSFSETKEVGSEIKMEPLVHDSIVQESNVTLHPTRNDQEKDNIEVAQEEKPYLSQPVVLDDEMNHAVAENVPECTQLDSFDPCLDDFTKQDSTNLHETSKLDAKAWLTTTQSSESQSMMTDTSPTSELQSEELQALGRDLDIIEDRNHNDDDDMSVTPLSTGPCTPADKEMLECVSIQNGIDQHEKDERTTGSLEKDEDLLNLAFTHSTISTTSKHGLLESPFSTEVDSIYNVSSIGGSISAAMTTAVTDASTDVKPLQINAQPIGMLYDDNGNHATSTPTLDWQQSVVPAEAWRDDKEGKFCGDQVKGPGPEKSQNQPQIGRSPTEEIFGVEPVDQDLEYIHEEDGKGVDGRTNNAYLNSENDWRSGVEAMMSGYDQDLDHLHANEVTDSTSSLPNKPVPLENQTEAVAIASKVCNFPEYTSVEQGIDTTKICDEEIANQESSSMAEMGNDSAEPTSGTDQSTVRDTTFFTCYGSSQQDSLGSMQTPGFDSLKNENDAECLCTDSLRVAEQQVTDTTNMYSDVERTEPTVYTIGADSNRAEGASFTCSANNPFASEFTMNRNISNENKDDDLAPLRTPDPMMAPERPNSNKIKKSTTSSNKKKEQTWFYVDLAYIPHHVNKNHCGVDFFKRIRSKYYVISGFDACNDEPNKQTLEYILEGKKTWDVQSRAVGHDDGDVTVIPTHNSTALNNWYRKDYKKLAAEKIHLVASGSKVLMHNEAVEACKIEF